MGDEPDQLQLVERKLATILSADVAEYSRLMANSEEETVRTFRGHKAVFESLIATHRGRIFNTAGDAILAEFNSAVEAVRCATEIQAALRTRNDQLTPSRQVKFRIGINLGDVMLQGSDLLGDGVNVAARIQAAAEPGGICISGSVYDQVRNKLSLSFQSMGEKNYKNIPHQIRTYSIAESEDFGRLPSRSARSFAAPYLKWIIAVGAAVLVLFGGYWAYAKYQHQQISQAQDGSYSGDVCMGPARGDEARCYVASGVTVNDSKISAKYPAKGDGFSNVITGDVTASGEVRMQFNIVNATGVSVANARLTGLLKNGRLIASGDGFRTYKVDWQRR
jgi:class 3 adenylate cyclase